MTYSENLLIEQLKEGNESAYRYIYDHHYTLLCHFANSYVKDHFLSEAIVSDMIFHLWEIRETLNISVSIRSYLLRAVRNRCINHLTSEQRKKEISFSSLLSHELTNDKITYLDSHPLGLLLERELEDKIYDIIDNLPIECRTVFTKTRFEGKTYKEAAQELGISINTVKYHVKNAISILYLNLREYLLGIIVISSLNIKYIIF